MALDNREFGRIGVLVGGPSSEREISLKSGKAVYDSLSAAGFDVVAIDIRSSDTQENKRLLKAAEINCAFIALHGSFGEDGQIQSILDDAGIIYTGSGVKASQLAMNKAASRTAFRSKGLSVPLSRVVSKGASAGEIAKDIALPLVVKPVTGGSSIGMSIVDKWQDLNHAVNLAFSFCDSILIEEYVRGREFTVGILNERALPVIEIIPKNKFFDYEAKYKKGMTDYDVPAKLSKALAEEIQDAALCAHNLLGCLGCSRVDMIVDERGRICVLEINTIPGLTETSLLPKAASCVGIDFFNLCLTLIRLAYAKTKK